MQSRVSKACQECRHRKLRCSGEQPCKSCRTRKEECIYRPVNRIRRRNGRSSTQNDVVDSIPGLQGQGSDAPGTALRPAVTAQQPAPSRDEEVYHSVSATHKTAVHGNVQLYYGASSNFAFLQQLHKSILADDEAETTTPGEVQEGSAGLDLFNQRPIFFGTTVSSVAPNRLTGDTLDVDALPPTFLSTFLSRFFESLHPYIPFVQEESVRHCANSLFSSEITCCVPSTLKSVTLALLAIGALATEHLDYAELLYTSAKRESLGFDEIVNLHSVQLSLLLSMFQNSMGRPNQSYLHLGAACRKAFAMGLHKDICFSREQIQDDGNKEEWRLTMWCLYFQEW